MKTSSRLVKLSPRSWSWSTRGLVAAGGLLAGVLTFTMIVMANGGGPTPATSPEVVITPSTSPSPSQTGPYTAEDGTPVTEEEPDYDIGPDCFTVMGAEAYQTFETSVFAYEEAFLAPQSPLRDAALAPLTTTQYQIDHSEVVADEGSMTLVRIIPDATIVSCIPAADGSRQVTVIPTIETSYINEAGERQIIFPEIKMPLAHDSTWVDEGGTWKVSQEE